MAEVAEVSARDEYFVAALCGLSFVLGIIQSYSVRKFERILFLPVVKVRFPRIVMLEAVVVLFVAFILFPGWLFGTWLDPLLWGHSNSTTQKVLKLAERQHMIEMVLSSAMSMATTLTTHIEALRLWLLYYDLRLFEAFRDEEWGRQITSNFWRSNFYLRNRDKRGNVCWITKRVVVYWFVASAASEVGHHYVTNNEVHAALALTVHAMKAVVTLLPFGFIVFLWTKLKLSTKAHADNMLIRYEFQCLCWLFAISSAGFLSALFLMALGFRFVASAAVTVSILFIVTAPSLISTLWIPHRINKNSQRFGSATNQALYIELGVFEDLDVDPLEELAALWMDQERMATMMRWMMADFSLECVLSFVEMTQFKEFVIGLVKQQNPHFVESDVKKKRHKFHKHCPQSSIVFGGANAIERGALKIPAIVEEDVPGAPDEEVAGGGDPVPAPKKGDELQLDEESLARLKTSAHLMFKKYLKVGAPLEVNIGYALRMAYRSLDERGYDPLRPMEWVALYDEVLSAMEGCIFQSYYNMTIKMDNLAVQNSK